MLPFRPFSPYSLVHTEDDEKDFAEGLLSGDVLLRRQASSSNLYKLYIWLLHVVTLGSVGVLFDGLLLLLLTLLLLLVLQGC